MKKRLLYMIPLIEILLIVFVTIFTFRDLPFTYFQQDEWVSLGLQKIGGITAELSQFSVHMLLAGLNRPLSTIIKYSLFTVFGTGVWPWAIFAIIIHCTNGFLVRKVARLFGISHVLATIAGAFYIICYSSHQSVSWLATSFTALPSLFFILVSIVFALEQRRTWAMVTAIISFYFKESSIAWMPLLPLLGILKWNIRSVTTEYKKYVFLFAFILFVVIMRIMDLYISGWESQLSVTVSSGVPKLGILVNAMLYPLISFSETFLPLPFVRKIIDLVFISRYSSLMNVENINITKELLATDLIGLYASFIFVCAIGFILYFIRKYQKIIAFSAVLLFFSFLPFSVTNRGGEYLDSRYFSFAAAAGGLLIAGIISSLVFFSKKYKHINAVVVVFISIGMAGYLYKQSVYITRDIRYQRIIGDERRHMLDSIKILYWDLPDKPVLYATGSAEAFYGISGMRLPLQQGPGYTFMVLFYDTGKIPKKFIRDMVLWGMLDQGYFEDGNQAFGYYHSFETLYTDVCSDKFNSSRIRSFYYDATNQKVIDITNDIVARIGNCVR